MSNDREFQHESIQDGRSIVEYLKALTDGFERGSLRFQDADGEMPLYPAGLMNLEVRASHRRDRVRVTLKIGWRNERKVSDSEHAASLRIDTPAASEGDADANR